jgi:TatD DNase family protein
MLIDTHCHLDYPQLAGANGETLEAVLARAETAGVGRCVTISTHVYKFATYAALAEKDPRVFFTIGTHPHNAAEEPNVPLDELLALSDHPRCIGIGEAGLDYHYDHSPRSVQQKVFRTHITAARETGLPLVIHARSADDDMARILREEMTKGKFSAILHCFSSGEGLLHMGLELGLYISFSGMLTFKKSEDLRFLAAQVPLNRLLVETDSPYLAPEPHRSQPCEPAYVAHTARTLAAVKGVSETEIAKITTANFYKLFRKAAALDGVKASSPSKTKHVEERNIEGEGI